MSLINNIDESLYQFIVKQTLSNVPPLLKSVPCAVIRTKRDVKFILEYRIKTIKDYMVDIDGFKRKHIIRVIDRTIKELMMHEEEMDNDIDISTIIQNLKHIVLALYDDFGFDCIENNIKAITDYTVSLIDPKN